MSTVGERGHKTQQCVLDFFQLGLEYRYLGNWKHLEGSNNVEPEILRAWLRRQGWTDKVIEKALRANREVDNLITKPQRSRCTQNDGSGLWAVFEFAKAVGERTTQKILSILKADPTASRKKIAARLGDITEDGVKYHLDKMKKEGLIRRVGPPKGGHWGVLEDEQS